ncbi:STM4504/CBY_0614 family protein [Sulfurovum sp. NBC37-1]|uniref:STM4504/CBY_0614 family protein n=1 Tax=Sulfurovum sp. (strain NBC37-1) TaxID=387093 RepID=UPI0001587490|nr:hypothetical protein [Sulfurovum sp. NBC37-1]BAF72080.1 conserved hypothetical protein [Sulfurovum sp. NBC37-1]
MGIFDLFSKRQKKLRGEIPDVYQYEDINNNFRVQVVHIIKDTFGKDTYGHNYVSNAFDEIHRILCKEYGVFSLKEDENYTFNEIYNFFLSTHEYEKALDIIELSFKFINKVVRQDSYQYYTQDHRLSPDEAIEELNQRFKEHGIGYQFESNELIRIDSQMIHSEVVKPVLKLLHNPIYSGANEEFLKAHEHYRNNRNQECLNECLKSFESTLKAICDKNNWSYNQNDTSKRLIKICFDNNLIPTYLQTQFSSLQQLFESGVPTIRNRNSGHGQGVQQIQVTNEITSYMLHLTASNILFLIQQEKLLHT